MSRLVNFVFDFNSNVIGDVKNSTMDKLMDYMQKEEYK